MVSEGDDVRCAINGLQRLRHYLTEAKPVTYPAGALRRAGFATGPVWAPGSPAEGTRGPDPTYPLPRPMPSAERLRTAHFETVTVPVSEWLGYAMAIADNDHDVAGGHPVDGFLLDCLEAIHCNIERAMTHLALFGDAA